jgi:hypothetical protein
LNNLLQPKSTRLTWKNVEPRWKTPVKRSKSRLKKNMRESGNKRD